MSQLEIAVIVGSVRQGRVGRAVGDWVVGLGEAREAARYSLVDLADHPLPFLEHVASLEYVPATDGPLRAWGDEVARYDGFVLVTPEYNRGTSAVLKNALDSAYHEFAEKAVGFVGYGSWRGTHAVAQLRHTAAELQLVGVRQQVGLLGFGPGTDFPDYGVFVPREFQAGRVEAMFTQLERWARAAATVRAETAAA